MVKKKAERPKLPRVRRPRWKDAGWLIMEPSRIGAVAGCFFAGIAALVFFVRQQRGVPMAVADVALGVAKTFVVSYVAAGLFVIYLLWVAEKELIRPEDPKQRRSLKGEDTDAASSEAPAQDQPAVEEDETQSPE